MELQWFSKEINSYKMYSQIKKQLQFLPLALWLFYFLYFFNISLRKVNGRLEAINLVTDLTPGDLPLFYSIAAFASFFDEIILLIIAILGYRYLRVKGTK